VDEQELKNKKLLSKVELQIEDSIINFKVELKSFDEIYKFHEKERDFWDNSNDKGGVIQAYISHFNDCLIKLDQFKNSINTFNEENLDQHWQNIKNFLVKTSTNQGQRILFSVTSHGKFIFDLFQENQTQGESAYRYFTNYGTSNLNDLNQFIGHIKAYEFENQNLSQIVKRRKLERKSLTEIQNEWKQKTQDLNISFEKQEIELLEWKNNFVSTQEKWQSQKDSDHDKFFKEQKVIIDELIEKSKTSLSDMENTYTKKLSLEGPVVYWKERIRKYKKQGIIWISLLSTVITFMVFTLVLILYNLPDAFHKKLFAGEPEAVKGIIIFATIISFGAYLSKTFTKLTFSSFHLQRDAEEREQLTMVYLALINEGKINTEERDLILQALFSRVETGLIGADSSPSMPGINNLLEKLIKK